LRCTYHIIIIIVIPTLLYCYNNNNNIHGEWKTSRLSHRGYIIAIEELLLLLVGIYISRRLNNRSAGINQQSSETLATNQKVIPGGHQVYSYTARFFPWNSPASRAGLEMKPKTWFLRCVDTIVIGEIIAPCNTWIELISRITTMGEGGGETRIIVPFTPIACTIPGLLRGWMIIK